MNIGNRISDLRQEKDFSRDDIGKKVGTSGAVIGRYEREEITPSIEVAAKIANALDVSLDYLTGGTSSIVKDKSLFGIPLLACKWQILSCISLNFSPNCPHWTAKFTSFGIKFARFRHNMKIQTSSKKMLYHLELLQTAQLATTQQKLI